MNAETPDPLTRGNFETFVRTALAGHSDSASKEEQAAFQLVQKLETMRSNLVALSAPALDGFCTLARFRAIIPVWENPSVQTDALIEALLEPPVKQEDQELPLIDESLPIWKKLQIAEKRAAEPTRHSEDQLARIAQLVSELYDPTSTTVAGIPR